MAGVVKKQISPKCSPQIYTSFKLSSELSAESFICGRRLKNFAQEPHNLLLEYIASQGWISVSSDLSTLSCTVSCQIYKLKWLLFYVEFLPAGCTWPATRRALEWVRTFKAQMIFRYEISDLIHNLNPFLLSEVDWHLSVCKRIY